MKLSILEPKGPIWQGTAKKVHLPAVEGEMCVLDFHQPFVVRLKKGKIIFGDMDLSGRRESVSIKDGIAVMRSDILTIFTQA